MCQDKAQSILFESGDYWVSAHLFGTGRLQPKSQGFAVWKVGVTHSTLVASIGFAGQEGLNKAITEACRISGKPVPTANA